MNKKDIAKIGKKVRHTIATYYREQGGELIMVCNVKELAEKINKNGGIPNPTVMMSHEIHLLAGDFLDVLARIEELEK